MALTPVEAREAYVSQLDRIERILRFTCRRNGLSADEAEEFRSEAHLCLIEEDYQLVRQVESVSTLASFLVVVTQRLLLDFRTRKWGKWRPSLVARQAGDVAVRLETLVVRDGIPFPEACEILRRNHGVTANADTLYALLLTFPQHRGLASQHLVALDEGEDLRDDDDPGERLADSERTRTEAAVDGCLRQHLGGLPAEDRHLLRLAYVDRQPVSLIARALGLDQRPLYRRLKKLQLGMRRALEVKGITREQMRDLMDSRRGLQLLQLAEILDESPSSQARGHVPSAAETRPG